MRETQKDSILAEYLAPAVKLTSVRMSSILAQSGWGGNTPYMEEDDPFDWD